MDSTAVWPGVVLVLLIVLVVIHSLSASGSR